MHVPVLAEETLAWLAIRKDGTYVDCTAGAGGHSACIAERLGPGGRLLAIDRDETAVALARKRLASYAQAQVEQGNYGDLGEILVGVGWSRVDGILIDAGVSSMQLDEAERGFSFQKNGPLDMRMDRSEGVSASQWLAETPPAELARVLREFGDVKKARKVASTLADLARSGRLESTQELAEAVASVFGRGESGRDETRRIFQAVRIAVNDELGELERGLESAIDALAPGGRLVVISFHSGEDRIAKQTLRKASRPHRLLHPDGRLRAVFPPRLRVLTKKPVRPTDTEIRENRRAQSACLRAVERLQDEGENHNG